LRAEVEKRLTEVRTRAYPSNGQLFNGPGQYKDGSKFYIIIPELSFAHMASHPWRVDVDLQVKAPDAAGWPGKAELDEMQQLAAPMNQALLRTRSTQRELHRTVPGHRIISVLCRLSYLA
jgi:hypothetical protein